MTIDGHATALAVAHEAADEAATIALAGLGQARNVGRKQSGIDLVTEFDLASERAIVKHLRAAFPDDEIVAEEGTVGRDRTAPRRWYVDPIDGTTNFAHGLPFFGISIALVDEEGPMVGVIDAPALGWRFFGVRGQGAHLRERGNVRRLSVSTTSTLDAALLATGFPYDLRTSTDDNVAQFAAIQRVAQAVRRVGAASLDLAMVAAGWLDGYWEQKLKPWDVAAGVLLVREAGGRVSTYEGTPFDVETGRIVADNGLIHEELLSALAAASTDGSCIEGQS